MTFLLKPYLYTFSLYENLSFIIFSAETEYISTRSWYRNINFLRKLRKSSNIVLKNESLDQICSLLQRIPVQLYARDGILLTFRKHFKCFHAIYILLLLSYKIWKEKTWNKYSHRKDTRSKFLGVRYINKAIFHYLDSSCTKIL